MKREGVHPDRGVPSALKPVYAYNIPYIRVGRSNQKMTSEAAYEMRQRTLGQTWDGLGTMGVSANALSGEALAPVRRRLPRSADYSPENLLTSLGLEKEGMAINAAVLLLDERLQARLPQAVIKCASISGRSGFARNPVTYEGTIIEQIDDALAYVLDGTNTVSITGAAARQVVYQYPPDALREAIVNAVCHRDYTQTDPIHIRLYDDHIEVWNPGELPAGLTLESLYRDHPSRPRNPKLALVLDKLGYIEQLGSGTLRIAEALESADQPLPDFASAEGVFRIRFYRGSEAHPQLASLTERQRAVMEILRSRGRLTTADLEPVFPINRRTLQIDIRRLVEVGMAVQGGSGPTVFYEPAVQWRRRRDEGPSEPNATFAVQALTDRELQCLILVAQGQTYAQIAETLGIGKEAVKDHLQRGYAKLGLSRGGRALAPHLPSLLSESKERRH